MEYQKIINLLQNKPNQSSKCRTKNWVEINDSCGTYSTTGHIKFKTSMLNIIVMHILVKGTITITGAGNNVAKRTNKRNNGVIFKIVHHSLTA